MSSKTTSCETGAKIIQGRFKWCGRDRRVSAERRRTDRRREVRYEPGETDRRALENRRIAARKLDSYRIAKLVRDKARLVDVE